MKIVMASSEMAPFAKTGGLADVMAALPRELAAMGHEVVVFLPYYRRLREHGLDVKPVPGKFTVPLGRREVSGELFEAPLGERLRLALVKHDGFFDRPHLYGEGGHGYPDNAERFIFFSKAIVAAVGLMRFAPDVLHVHDWHTALAPLWWKRALGIAWRLRSVFTVHNLAYQGLFPPAAFELTNLPGAFFATYGLEFYRQLNLLKAGLLYSEAVTTVSPRYAEEIRTPEFGCGLEGLLHDLGPKLRGVLNGADYSEWNPELDPHIAARYSAGDLGGKRACKRALLAAFGLPAERETAPLIGAVSRIEKQKGFDLIAEAIPEIVKKDASLVILGSGDSELEGRFRELAAKHPAHIGLQLGFNNPLAHRIQAGADLLLMPSRFEPCGLTQIYALRYGTIPVVRATGGLADTVQQFNPISGTGTGFRFDQCSAAAMLWAVGEALEAYRKPERWLRLVQNAMACDYSWRQSAQRYVELYQPS